MVLSVIFIPVLYVVFRTLAPGGGRYAAVEGDEEAAHG